MSFKLFFASTFGFIKSTAKIEAEYDKLLADYQLFCSFENSDEHREYHELEVLVKSATFLQKKKELQRLSLKGSKEEAQLKEFNKLGKNSKLHKFYVTLKSEELKRFEKISNSETLAKYKELKTAVEKHSLSALKNMDKQSKEYALYTEFEKLRDSSDLVFFREFRKSAAFKNYELMMNSPEHKRHEELQKITSSDEFKARLAYLEDKQKWEKTEDAAKEKRFAELQKKPEVVNFLKYKHSPAFDFFKKWELVFEDKFEKAKLDAEKWSTLSHWGVQALGQNFSQMGDLHAFTDGKNVLVDGKSLKIEVRKEKTKGMQWQMPLGFVEREFDYSAGLICSSNDNWWKHGLLEAKVKYAPVQSMLDTIYLLGEESSPQVSLVEAGAKNRLGMLTKSADGIKADCESISGLKAGEYYIFSLEWTAHSLIWKINGREMLTVSHSIPAFKMNINATSIIVSEAGGLLPHRFEIDWIRFYQHHKA